MEREGTSIEPVLEEPEKVVSLQLRVAEAYHKDAGKGVARIGAVAIGLPLPGKRRGGGDQRKR